MGRRIRTIGILIAVLAVCAANVAVAQRPRAGHRSGLSSPPVRHAMRRRTKPHQVGTAHHHPKTRIKQTNLAVEPTPEIMMPESGRAEGYCRGCASGTHTASPCLAGPFRTALPGFFGPYDRRYVGPGQPLQNGSWLNRPYSFGVMAGILSGDELLPGNVDQQTDMVGGYRLGWDLDHFWGTEIRFAFAALDLENEFNHAELGTGDVQFWDINALYYPWGDSRWRPYLSVGLGLAHFKFMDWSGRLYRQDLIGLPVGIGIKHRFSPWCVLRVDLTDNIGLANNDVDTMHNLSFMFSTEIRFGGERTSYWPWIPN